jgi:hypothetical protein
MITFASQMPLIPKICVEQRMAEGSLATPSYRRDIYRILHKTPKKPLLDGTSQSIIDKPTTTTNQTFRSAPNTQPFYNQTSMANSSMANSSIANSSMANSTKTNGPKKTYLRWLFKMNTDPNGQQSFNGCEFVPTPEKMDDAMYDITLQALTALGGATHSGIAVTEAFEQLLSNEYIPWWTHDDIRSLSIPFIAAFGRLLGGLDLGHAIKSRVLSPKDINLLLSIPHIKEVMLPILELYQDPL